VTGNRSEAEEIMQEAFLRLWERWDRVSGLEDLTAYLFRTAMNVFRNRYRRAALALRRTVSPASSEDALRTVEDRDAVVRALKGLSSSQRAAVLLTGYVGLTSEEAGALLHAGRRRPDAGSSSQGADPRQGRRASVIDERELFERAIAEFAPPDRSFDRLVRRRDAKRRNRRIGSAAVALVVAALLAGGLVRVIVESERRPASPSIDTSNAGTLGLAWRGSIDPVAYRRPGHGDRP